MEQFTKNRLIIINCFIYLFTYFTMASVYAASVNGIRVWRSPENTRVVFDLDSAVKFDHFLLDSPERLVIDIEKSSLKNKALLKNLKWNNTDIAQLRYSTGKNKSQLRIVLDLNNKISYKIFSLAPNGILYGHRLVLDISNKTEKQNLTNVRLKLTTANTPKNATPHKVFTVIIDPGHGGEDPGALGPLGTKEKDVVLQISTYLKQYIDQDKNMRAVLTRNNDYYIGLRERTEKARYNQADLFVSVHADGFKDYRAKGASVFVLSERGATSELAKWIADRENASDLVGGVSLDNKDAMLATVLLDLSQTASNRLSYQAANTVLQEMSKVSDLHKSHVEKAGFVVLKSPDIPSILIETGFISNPRGEQNLRTSAYQRKLAYAIYKGLKRYIQTQPRPNFDDVIMQANND